MTPLRLLLVDDHALFRDGLRALLEHNPDLVVVGEAGDGVSAVQLVLDLQPDIVLMDLHLPQLGGVEAIEQIISLWPGARIIVLTMYLDDDLIARAVHAGAVGYILKDSRAPDLLQGIRAAAEGRVAMDPAVAARLVQLYRRGVSEAAPATDDPPHLSARELSIIRLVAEGLTNRQTAQQLFLSEQTVKNNLSIIYEKLGVSNRTQAVSAALRAGLLPPRRSSE